MSSAEDNESFFTNFLFSALWPVLWPLHTAGFYMSAPNSADMTVSQRLFYLNTVPRTLMPPLLTFSFLLVNKSDTICSTCRYNFPDVLPCLSTYCFRERYRLHSRFMICQRFFTDSTTWLYPVFLFSFSTTPFQNSSYFWLVFCSDYSTHTMATSKGLPLLLVRLPIPVPTNLSTYTIFIIAVRILGIVRLFIRSDVVTEMFFLCIVHFFLTPCLPKPSRWHPFLKTYCLVSPVAQATAYL